MIATNISQLEDAVNIMLAQATENMEHKVYDVVDSYIKKFYSEWTPGTASPWQINHNSKSKYINNYGYQRMHQLIKSLIKTDIAKVGNSFEAKVYLDFSKMNHDVNFVNGRWIRHKHWPEEKIGSVAAESVFPHGGWESGTTIWVDPIRELNSERRQLLKQMLIEAGIQVI